MIGHTAAVGDLEQPAVIADPEPQAVLNSLSEAAVFLVVSANDQPGAVEQLRDVASDINGLVRAVGFRQSAKAMGSGPLSCVVGFGSTFWDRIRPAGAPRPIGLHPFRPLAGPVHLAPSTAGDVLFHIRADRNDLTFELSRQIMAAIGSWVRVDDHVTGFRYFDARDLLGFVDGTENPTGRSAKTAALIGATEPDFVNGSYVLVQKYLHDLAAWNELSTEDQERAIGRTKLEDIEIDENARPNNSHLSLNTITDDNGVEHDILRDNMVFGNAGSGEYGTYYIAYASDPAVPEEMLTNMFVGKPRGNSDRILDFSRAVTGSLFFVPSLDLLESLADEEITQSPEDGTVRAGA
jgi:putative iron-dependent peroxidase